MFGIGDFFKRIQNSYGKEIFIRSAVQNAIKKYTGSEVPIKDMTFKGEVVTLSNISQSLRSVLYIKKQNILKEINSVQGARVISDIR